MSYINLQTLTIPSPGLNTYFPAGETVGNSISTSPIGMAVATTYGIYMFSANSGTPQLLWSQQYIRGPARKPGQLTWGTGSTPVFFGPTTGQFATCLLNIIRGVDIIIHTIDDTMH